jgi:ATP-dependent Clp protease ATP-binding subunit ClpA
MRLDKFTEKAQEALQETAELARARGQQAVEPEHLLLALVADRRVTLVVTEVARKLLAKRGWDPSTGRAR